MSTHKIKCEICGLDYETDDDLSRLLFYGPTGCPYCRKILKLKELLQNYSHIQLEKTIQHEKYDENLVKDNTVPGVELYSLAPHKEYYDVKTRTRNVQSIIERIEFARQFIYTRLGPQFEILDSIYERKDIFWKESGNILLYVHDACFQYIVIKLKELLSGSESKYSVLKIKNILTNGKKHIYNEQKISLVYKFDESGKEIRVLYDPFPIAEYLKEMQDVLEDYKETIDALSLLRDKQFAHLSDYEEMGSTFKLTYVNIKRIFNSLKIIYDGFYYSIAPDKYVNLVIDSNMRFSHMNKIVDFYNNNFRKNDR